MMQLEIPYKIRGEVLRAYCHKVKPVTRLEVGPHGFVARPTLTTAKEEWDNFFIGCAASMGAVEYRSWINDCTGSHTVVVPMLGDNPQPVKVPPTSEFEWDTPEPARPSDLKETNPKAAVGVRKVSLSVVPMDVVLEASLGMLEGAAKYGKANYLASGARASVYYDGTLRHLNQWWLGEDVDPDSGLHHISKAISSLMVLRSCMLATKFTDDRPPLTGFDMQQLNEVAAQILDKHKDKNPRHYTIQDEV